MLENLKLEPIYDGFLYLAESTRNLPSLKSHHHIELELNLVVRGGISYVVSGRRFTFERRTLLWLFPSQEHQLVDRTSDAQCYVAVFTPGLIARSCHSTIYEGLKRDNAGMDGVLHTRLEPETFDLVRKTMDALMKGAPDPDVLNREAGFGVRSDFRFKHDDPDGLNAGLHHLLLLAWRVQRPDNELGGAVPLLPAVREALDLLSETTCEHDLGQLARRCGASGAHLSRMFARQVGVPMSRYRNSVRLGRFFEHFRGPERKTVTEAAYMAGFGSYAQFHRVFTRAYGRGPRECLQARACSEARA
ncbi:MAG: AraC family transcriptional regulator [Opitutaceae bacterium]|nr:AraC family transcriptional regulator [Opitutaceae bacterium]